MLPPVPTLAAPRSSTAQLQGVGHVPFPHRLAVAHSDDTAVAFRNQGECVRHATQGGTVVPRSEPAPAFTFTLVDGRNTYDGAIRGLNFIPGSTIIFLQCQVGTFVATLDVPAGIDPNGEVISERRVNWCLFHDYGHQSLTVTLHDYRGYHSHPIDLASYCA